MQGFIISTNHVDKGHYMQLTLVDELTGKTEAHAFDATGKEFESLTLELKQEQIKQDSYYYERVKYFRGN